MGLGKRGIRAMSGSSMKFIRYGIIVSHGVLFMIHSFLVENNELRDHVVYPISGLLTRVEATWLVCLNDASYKCFLLSWLRIFQATEA